MIPLVLCTLIIVITLLTSGFAKARDRASTAAAIVNLKLDQWLPLKFVSRVLPWAEIALAVWLLVVPGWPAILGGVAAVVLFAAYWIVIARAVFTGNTASCNCFGGESSAPISAYTLGRNTALLGAAIGALILATDTHHSALSALLNLDGASWLWLLGALFAAVALWCMYRSELLAPRVAESATAGLDRAGSETAGSETVQTALQAGEAAEEYIRLPIPYGMLTMPNGEQRPLRELAQAQARILFFVSPGCSPCHEVLPHIPTWQKKLPMLKLHPVVASQEFVPQLGLPDDIEVAVDEGFTMQPVFARATPMAVALGADGLLAGGPVLGSGTVIEFMQDIMEEFDVT